MKASELILDETYLLKFGFWREYDIEKGEFINEWIKL